MINVAISYGFGEDNRYSLSTIPPRIQLASYKHERYKSHRDEIINTLRENETEVVAIHLPLDILRINFSDGAQMIRDLMKNLNCDKFVLHPNKGFENFLRYSLRELLASTPRYFPKICLETFGWKSNKGLRTPLEIIEFIAQENTGRFSMVIDTSHIEELWFDHRILGHLLKYTSIIHLSNRAKGVGQHLPFNDQRGNLNLVKFVKELKQRYKWHGEIVLEYMPEYSSKLLKNAEYITELLK